MELGIDISATRSALIDGLHSPDGAALSAALDAMILTGNCEPRQRLRVLRILEAQPGAYKKTAIRQMIAMLEAECHD